MALDAQASLAPAQAAMESRPSWRFIAADLQRWAEYSGDYNPIHFDLSQARRLGMDELVVHGMLTMLPVKGFVSRHDVPEAGQWLRMRTLLRRPLPLGGAYSVAARSRRDGVAFSALCPDTDVEYLRGSCVPIDAPHAANDAEPTFATRTIDRGHALAFAEHYGAMDCPRWVGIDAIVFADFMRTQIEAMAAHVRSRSLEGVAVDGWDGPMVHSSHVVSFDRELLGEAQDRICDSELSYQVGQPELMRGAEQLICSITLTVLSSGRHVMTIDIGLVIKA